jgi:hypothetical protein
VGKTPEGTNVGALRAEEVQHRAGSRLDQTSARIAAVPAPRAQQGRFRVHAGRSHPQPPQALVNADDLYERASPGSLIPSNDSNPKGEDRGASSGQERPGRPRPSTACLHVGQPASITRPVMPKPAIRSVYTYRRIDF